MSNVAEEFGIPVVHAELVRDRTLPFRRLTTKEDIVNILHEMLDRSPTEQFITIYLHDTVIVGIERTAIGQSGRVAVGMPEIFRGAILAGATHIVVGHNHLNNYPTPSDPDIDITDIMVRASMLMGIELIDHIIVSPDGTHYSMIDHLAELEVRVKDLLARDMIKALEWDIKKYRMLPGLDLNKKLSNPTSKLMFDIQDKLDFNLDFFDKKI